MLSEPEPAKKATNIYINTLPLLTLSLNFHYKKMVPFQKTEDPSDKVMQYASYWPPNIESSIKQALTFNFGYYRTKKFMAKVH